MVQNVIIINSSNYNKQNSNGNSFLYKFPREIPFNATDKIGIQSASIFNSFYNITSKLNNNKMSIVFPCNNPNGGSTAVMQCYIGNSVQFTGQVSNPPNLEISGATISPSLTSTFTGFIGGTKYFFTSAYISGNTLFLTLPNNAPAQVVVGMYINGSDTYITSINRTVNGANTTTSYILNNSALSPVGSSASPLNTIFACGTGKNIYVTTTPSTTLSTGPIFVKATGFVSQAINESTTSSSTLTLLSTSSDVYLSSRSITAGVGSYIFTGTADAPIYTGMTFTLNAITYTIVQSSVQGTLYTLTLDKVAGVFPTSTVNNVGIPNNSFSILTVTGIPTGNGIYLPGSGTTMTLSGVGINSNIQVLDAISSTGTSVGGAGVYKISYNPNTLPVTMLASDSVTNNTVLYISSLTGGSIQSGMSFQVGGRVITIGTQLTGNTGSVGTYNISTPNSIIPSIYPQQITASSSFSNNITINFTIQDGYYTADTMNKYLQQIMISNNLYLIDGVNGQTSLFYVEITQNPTFYALQVNVHPLPQTLTATQTYPTGAQWTLLNDGSKYNPILVLPEGIQAWFGYSSTIKDFYIDFDSSNTMYIPKTTTALNGMDFYYLSTICPRLNTINSLVLCCNLINSDFSIPSNLFFNIPLSSSFGNLITVNPFDPSLVNVRGGGYESYIEITFFDTDFNPISIRDTDITLTLVINRNDIY
jgi:hypothetical protein